MTGTPCESQQIRSNGPFRNGARETRMTGETPTTQGRIRVWMERIGMLGPASLLIVAGFVLAYHFVQTAPPRQIVMATGSKDGAYHYHGRIYHDLLAQEGIDVTIVETAGSIANIDLLERGKADVAFVQGGAATTARPRCAAIAAEGGISAY
jgi:hypothetical protein